MPTNHQTDANPDEQRAGSGSASTASSNNNPLNALAGASMTSSTSTEPAPLIIGNVRVGSLLTRTVAAPALVGGQSGPDSEPPSHVLNTYVPSSAITQPTSTAPIAQVGSTATPPTPATNQSTNRSVGTQATQRQGGGGGAGPNGNRLHATQRNIRYMQQDQKQKTKQKTVERKQAFPTEPAPKSAP